MIVTTSNLQSVLNDIKQAKIVAFDTETTGLEAYKDDKLFSIILSTEKDNYYFNFKAYDWVEPLDKSVLLSLKEIFRDEDKTFIAQNAKFDMAMLAREGIFIAGTLHDTAVIDRIHFNQHSRYNLAEISKRWGDEKLDIVWKFIEDNNLKSKIFYSKFNKTIDKPHFDLVPFSIIQPYGEQDGQATLNAGLKILGSIKEHDDSLNPEIQKQQSIVKNESRLVKTIFDMEYRGVQLDMQYCEKALSHYVDAAKVAEDKFSAVTGVEFVKGTTVFEEVFSSEKEKWEKTEKGNWRWDASILSSFDNPAGRIAIDYAEAKKQSEYFANFLFHCDSGGVLHPDFQQSGTVTGRLSCRNPNLQNLTNSDKYEDETEASIYPVRRAFVPRPDYFFAMIDYSQSEFRLALDYAGATSLINEVLNGLDVHTATANLAGVSRKEAKTVNFLSIYGGGVVKLAQNLNKGVMRGSQAQLGAIYKSMFGWRLSDDEKAALPTITGELRQLNEPLIKKAYDTQQAIFRASPEIKDFLKQVQKVAETRGYIRNFYGRRYFFPDKKWAYKAPNHLIQGTCADMLKLAMNNVSDYLKNKKSRMILQIHDELVIETHKDEGYVLCDIKKLMEEAYIPKRLPQVAEISYSNLNLSEKLKYDK